MGDLLIRNIPDALKADLEMLAGKEGSSLSAKAVELLRKGVVSEKQAEPTDTTSAWDALRAAYVDADALDDEYVAIMNDIEAKRKKEFFRPSDGEA